MTKSKIKQELWRSACEDENPFAEIGHPGLAECVYFSDWPRKGLRYENEDDMRTFFLLIAEAL